MYWFLDDDNRVLYVGKAKNLKKRVSSYTRLKQLNNRIRRMSLSATQLKFLELGSELEALLTEAELIRTYLPEFNVALKDDKSPLYILITHEDFPRVLKVRKKEKMLNTVAGDVIGPFPNAYKVSEVLRIVRPIFPWCNRESGSGDGRPCFYYHIQQCPGACVGKISEQEYKENIEKLKLFLRGKSKEVKKLITIEMKTAVDALEYEQAAVYRDQLKLIETVTNPTYKLQPELVTAGLRESTAKDGLHYLRRLISEYMQLPKNIKLDRIEGYDVSNISGTNASVAMVTFVGGAAEKQEYKSFNIKTLNTPNDYGMMQEALLRRQNHPEWGTPHLLIIDGGKGQLRAALSVWTWDNPVISIAKRPDRLILPYYTHTKQGKQKLNYHILNLPPTHPALKLVQQVRDESHRFSKYQHTRRRTKAMFE